MLKKRGPWAKAGDLLAVPLREVRSPTEEWPDSGDWGVGLVGVKPKDAHAILGWWFACRFAEPPTIEMAIESAKRREAVLIEMSGSYMIRDGRWLNLGPFPGYTPAHWKVPLRVNRSAMGGPWLVLEDMETLRERWFEVPDGFDITGLPEAGSATCGALEVLLSKSLAKYESVSPIERASLLVREVDPRAVLGPVDD